MTYAEYYHNFNDGGYCKRCGTSATQVYRLWLADDPKYRNCVPEKKPVYADTSSEIFLDPYTKVLTVHYTALPESLVETDNDQAVKEKFIRKRFNE